MSSTFPEEKLDPRVKRTRQLLEQAFLEVASEKGFQAVSVQDIAEKAGVNRATFYDHFTDKYELLDYSVRQSFRQEIEKRMLNVCTYSSNNLHALIIAVCEYIVTASSHCNPPSQQFEQVMETQVKLQVQELIQKWLEKVETDVDPKLASTATSWAIYGLAIQWSHDKSRKRPSAEKFADEVLPLISSNLHLMQTA
jgi:AcrR family transcriptional regulator